LIRSFASWRALRAQLAALALAAWLLSPAAARADDSGLYLGASGGYTLDSYHRADLNEALVENLAASDYTLVLRGASLHEQGTPWALEVGYRFSSYFGLEASYLELSSLRYQSVGTAIPPFGSSGKATFDLDFKSRGPTLSFVGVLPLTNQWNLEARLGAYEGKTTTDYAASVIGSPSSGAESQTSASVLASVGTQYVIAPHWVVRLDYTRLNSLGEKLLDKSFNVDLLTAGVFYAF
jgi:opacity protein-like surface antigen